MNVTALPKAEWRFPQDGDAYQITTGCDFKIEDEAVIPQAIAKIEQAMTPATQEQCEGWLVMLQASTARRADSDATSMVAYAVYTSELRKWPADVAKAACERLARGKLGHTGPNWFPTLAEIYHECQRMAAPREVMLSALHKWAPKELPYPSARGRPEPSEADKAQVRRMADQALAELNAAAERVNPRKTADLPSIAGKADEGGLTPLMRAAIERRNSSSRDRSHTASSALEGRG